MQGAPKARTPGTAKSDRMEVGFEKFPTALATQRVLQPAWIQGQDFPCFLLVCPFEPGDSHCVW